MAGDLEAEVGRIARDVPGAQAAFAVQPLLQLGLDPGHRHVTGQPLAQEALELADLEEEVLRFAQLGRGAADHGVGRLEFGRRIGRAAVLAVVAVLLGRAAVGAGALDVAVGQEHPPDRVVQLGDRAARDVAVVVELAVDRLGQRAVVRRVRGIVVVEGDPERVEVAFVAGLDAGDEGFRRGAGLLGGQHDRGAVGVVGAHEVHRAAGHAPRPHPDVGLDVAHQVAQVQRAVGIGQGVGDEGVAGHGGRVRGRLAIIAWRVGTPSRITPAGAAPARTPCPSRRASGDSRSEVLPRKANDPAKAGSRDGSTGRRGYSRTHTCCRQMKAMQPDIPSLLPPSSISTLDL